jgi:hypothetical protein
LSSFPNSPSLPHHDSPNPAPFGQNFTGKGLLPTAFWLHCGLQ